MVGSISATLQHTFLRSRYAGLLAISQQCALLAQEMEAVLFAPGATSAGPQPEIEQSLAQTQRAANVQTPVRTIGKSAGAVQEAQEEVPETSNEDAGRVPVVGRAAPPPAPPPTRP